MYDAGLELDAFIRGSDGRHVTGYVWPGVCVFPDFLRPDVRRWWADLHAVIFDAGVAGVWNDMNEPALYDGPVGAAQTANVVEMPADAVHDGSRTARAPRALFTTSTAWRWRGRRATRSHGYGQNERSFALTRSGHTGIQRFAARVDR